MSTRDDLYDRYDPVREQGRPWYLVTGLIIGLGIGLLYAWVVSPIRYVDTAPYSLREEYKDQYRVLVALAYGANGDLGRARARLNTVRDESPTEALAAQAQRALGAGGDPGQARPLALLAASLNGQFPTPSETGQGETPVAAAISPPAVGTPEQAASGTPQATPDPVRSVTPTLEPSATLTPAFTVTSFATRTPAPTQGAPFALTSREEICAAGALAGQLQVEVLDGAGTPVPGVKIIVSWADGQNAFFTGLQQEISPGYADFRMEPGISYTLRLGDGGEVLRDLTTRECLPEEGAERVLSGWRLVFQQ